MRYWLLALLWLGGCGISPTTQPLASLTKPPALPVSVSNNAVALVRYSPDSFEIFSLAGLANGKTWRHASDRVFAWKSGDQLWRQLDPVPGKVGRLAATAQVAGGLVYFFGGYTVAQDGSEFSTADAFALNPKTGNYLPLPDMPVAVDDAVSGVYQDRFIYLVSGWHQNDNVDNVQVFDTQTHSWLQATVFPGAPVFGHSGGLAENTLIICDGVKVEPPLEPNARRRFVTEAACYSGLIDIVDPTIIRWRSIPHHPGATLYRSAAIGIVDQVLFYGGSENPYNYDGVGYDGNPSKPSNLAHAWLRGENRWQTLTTTADPSMDHRGLLRTAQGQWITVGGMGRDQRMLDHAAIFQPKVEH